MTDQHREVRRAHDALTRAITPGPDDFDHPAYEVLEALANGSLSDVDREAVESHLAACRVCAEDLADLTALAAEFRPAAARASAKWRPLHVAMIGGGLAAAILLAVVVTNRSTSPPRESSRAASRPIERPAPSQPSAATADRGAALTEDERQLVARVVQNGRLDLPDDVRALRGRTGTLLGGSEERRAAGPINPRGTAVLSPRPAFTWHPTAGARSYTVAVFDENFAEVARSDRLATSSWTPPRDLPRARSYVWQVTAHLASGDVATPTPPEPEARFRVVDARTATRVADQQTRLADQPLALGIVLAHAGLLADAEAALARASPESAVAQTLLAELRTKN